MEIMISNFVFTKYFVFFLSITNGTFLCGMDPFYSLPPEITRQILCHCSHNDSDKEKDIIKTVKTVISLNSVCKEFQKLLNTETIGTLFDQYDGTLKSTMMKRIVFCKEKTGTITGISPTFYLSKRRFISGLLCSGAELTKGNCALVYSAVKYNDVELIQFLHDKKKVDLYQQNWNKVPLFFYAPSVAMIQLYEKNDIKLDTISSHIYPNILWVAVGYNTISAEVVKYYLEKNIFAGPRSSDGLSLLHALADCNAHTNIDNMLNKAALLLAKQPELINAFAKDKKTPLDCAQRALDRNFSFFDDTAPADKMIAFLKSRDGKTSKELLPQTAKDEEECVLF